MIASSKAVGLSRQQPPLLGDLGMDWIKQALRIPATESSMALVLSLAVAALGLMSVALVWQAEIIASQRDIIRWLEAMKFGA